MTAEKVICAGFGGQGVLSLGRLMAYAGMIEGKQVSWLPSYGPEMRGGTANCHVIISEEPIGSPIVSRDATSVIVMNLPSLVKFESELVPGGRLFVNSSLIEREPSRTDAAVYRIPANAEAGKLGSDRIANMVMLGAWLARSGALGLESVLEGLRNVFGASKEDLFTRNMQAISRGMELASSPAPKKA